MTDRELMQQALKALKLIDEAMPFPVAKLTIKNLSDRLAQPEQEPVAWMDEFGNVFPLGAQRGPKHLNELMKPLYTTPPQRKPLTDEEILSVARDHYNPHERAEISFARAIEAELKVKNNGQ